MKSEAEIREALGYMLATQKGAAMLQDALSSIGAGCVIDALRWILGDPDCEDFGRFIEAMRKVDQVMAANYPTTTTIQ